MIKMMGVVGAGQMGAGIAQVAAQNGIDVVLSDVSEERVAKGRASIEASLARFVQKSQISDDDKKNTLSRIQFAADAKAHSQCDLIIEAVSEDEALKRKVLKSVDECMKPEAILASNTSSISITRLASCTGRADRFMGMHFMNPVPLMKLVELIRGMNTSEETYQTVKKLAEKMQKTTTTSRDFPGFIANRVLMPMINEAFFALMEGVGSAEDIDTTMKLGCNQPMGPLQLADFIGLDTCLAIIEVLHRELGDSKYRPCPLLRSYVAAGRLGKKSGLGVFAY